MSTATSSAVTGAPPPSISPGALSTPGTAGGPAFLLSSTEWLTIQTYVVNALSLPTTETAFQTWLGPGAPSSMTPFDPLIACYLGINGHCTTWQNTVFPTTVNLASDIYQYGAQKAPIYYKAILTEANILINDPTNANALAALKAILDNLSATATTYSTNAAAAAAQVQTFAQQTQADKVVLVGPNGDAGLVKTYNDEYGSQSAAVVELNKEIAAQQIILDAANEEYNKDVVIAATTPTYAWVWPFGTIAAAVVAGIYGKRATDALDRAHAAQAKIKSDTQQVQADANLMIAIQMAQTGMNQILNALSAALPVIQKIQGIWGGIAKDIGSIVSLIETDIRQALPVIMNLGVDEAIQSWASVATEANNYRVNAYVTVSDKPSGGTASPAVTVH
jgi:hypothetical protein